MSEALPKIPARERANEIEAIAAAALERRDFGDWTSDDEARFEVWLAQSPLHRAAFWRLEAAWDHTRRLQALQNHPAEAPSVSPLSPRGRC